MFALPGIFNLPQGFSSQLFSSKLFSKSSSIDKTAKKNFENTPRHHSGFQPYVNLKSDPGKTDLEEFVKESICYPLNPGDTVEMRNKDGGTDTYTIYRKIACNGLVSYALTSKNKDIAPLIVFRCTEPDVRREQAIESLQNDFDVNIGERGWKSAEPLFEDLMNDRRFRQSGQKIKVVGYSLGGVHAQHFIAKFHKRVKHGIFFSAPSMSARKAESFAKIIGNKKYERESDPLHLQIYRTKGDPCHFVGGKQLGWGIDTPNVQVQLLEAVVHNKQGIHYENHRKRVFEEKKSDFTVFETKDPKVLNIHLDNSNKERKPFLETCRKIYGPFEMFLLDHLIAARNSFRNQQSPVDLSREIPLEKRFSFSLTTLICDHLFQAFNKKK